MVKGVLVSVALVAAGPVEDVDVSAHGSRRRTGSKNVACSQQRPISLSPGIQERRRSGYRTSDGGCSVLESTPAGRWSGASRESAT